MDKQDHLVLLTSVPTEAHASVIVAALKEGGVRAVATGAYTAGFAAEAPGWVQVMVEDDCLPRAKELLSKLKSEAAGGAIDWSAVDVGRPEDAQET